MNTKTIITLFLLLFLTQTTIAQRDTIDIFNLSIEDLMSIKVISPTKTQETIENAPAVIEVITDKDIEKYGYNTLAEALENVAGIFITNDYVSHNISMRGINSGKKASSRTIKIMINGQSIAFHPTSENFIDFAVVPMNLIKRIEILRGPSSTLYGANAFLGVINIITKTAEEGIQSSIQLQNSGITNYGVQSEILLAKNRFSIAVGASYSYQNRSGLSLPFSTAVLQERISYLFPDINPFEYKTSEDIAQPATFFGNIKFSAENWEFDNQTFFQLVDYSARFFEDNPVLNRSRLQLYNGFTKSRLKKSFQNEKLKTELNFGFSNGAYFNNTIFDYSPDSSNYSVVKPHLGYKSFEINGFLLNEFNSKNNLVLGLDYEMDLYNLLSYSNINQKTSEVLSTFQAKGTSLWQNAGIYGQFQSELLSNLKTTISARYDFHNIYGQNLNYRAALVYNPPKKYSVKLSYGTSFKAPTPMQLYTPDVPYNPISGSLGNPVLAPEYLQTAELAFFIFSAGGIISEFTAFYNRAQNIVVEKMLASLPSPVNEQEIKGYGIEYTLKYSNKKLSAHLNYSFQNTWFNHKELNYHSSYLFPTQMANLKLHYIAGKYFSISLINKYTGKYLASINNIEGNLVYGTSQDYYLGNHIITDLAISTKNILLAKREKLKKQTPKINFQLKIKNLLDKKYLWPGYYYYDIQAPGRQVWLKTSLMF